MVQKQKENKNCPQNTEQAQEKDLKIELKSKCCIENISF